MASPKRCRANQNSSPTSNDSNNPKKQKGENFDFAPTSTSGNKNRKLTQSPARFTAVKNDDNSPTWKDDPRPIKLHGDKSNDEYWLTGYLGFLTKYLLRNLGLSPLVLPWAIEQDLFKFIPEEVSVALATISESEEFGDGDTKLDLSVFQGPDEIIRIYISPYEGEAGQAKPKQVPSDKRIEALVRILITVHEEMECLSDQFQFEEEGHAFFNQRKGPTEARVRSLNDMPYFGLPDIHLKR